ncbi:MAG: (2Fe-2S) ferredoxin domain-containing protein [Clostridiales bacterium]|jgi:NADP-reducing hydrogenase subunit HndB|nr:(2Fe-2S) ferredoxin domain-containing protein [Clostridiales bacterium]
MKTLQELQEIRDRMKSRVANRETADESDVRIVVGMATCGIAAGARPVLAAIGDEIESRKLTNVKVSQTGCIGICAYEPIVEVYVPNREKVTYVHMTPEKVGAVIARHIVNGSPVTEYTYSYAVANRGGNA